MPITVNSPSTINAIMNNNGSPASPAPPRQPHSVAALAQLSKHVVQSVHMQRVPGKWQSAHILQKLENKKKINNLISMPQ